MPEYLKKAFMPLFLTAIASIWFAMLVFYLVSYIANEEIAYIVVGIIIFILFLYYYYEEIKEDYEKEIKISDEKVKQINKEKDEFEARANQIIGQVEDDRDIFKQSLAEKNAGFPTLLKAIKEYSEARDKIIEDYLKYKSHPSLKGAEAVREQSRRRRDAEFECKRAGILVEKYEEFAPFLLDYKEGIDLPENEDILSDYSDEEKLDPTINYLSKEEFRKLPSVERNQRALDRYWKRPKSKWHLGKIYERYVGYLYEQEGYDVEYSGIIKRLEDLGRDLIATKGNEIIIIQCKNWANFKKIYENSIFQFFGTVFKYRDENKNKKVRAIFYSTTELSPLARRFAIELGIELKERFKMKNDYPCIKCNIGRKDNTRIYHLPFDQQYDKVIVENNRGEFFCKTVKEAEKAGFRRAFRYKGLIKK